MTSIVTRVASPAPESPRRLAARAPRLVTAERGVSRKVQELLPTLRARREDIERQRALPPDLAEMLRQTGIFDLGVPRALGGTEASPLEIMATLESVSTADGSAGWCAMIGTANNVVSGYMSEAGAREVFAAPVGPTAGIAAPAGAAVRVPGGVRVTGRWGFASGIAHCEWTWAGCVVMEDGMPRMTPHGPEIVHVVFPAAAAVIHDTWHVSGLCGTGSCDFSVKDVFVPEHRIFALLDPAGHRHEPLYQMPPLPLFVFQVVCVSLGVARAALDELTEIAQTKVPTLYTQPLAERAMAQIELARTETALGAARALLFQVVGELWGAVSLGQSPAGRDLARARSAATHVAETAAAVTRTANALAGGASLYSSSSLQRHARDAEAITHHFTVAPHTWEQAGRVLLGREPLIPAF